MTVLLTIAKTSLGAQVADPLSGGGVGYDIGVIKNGSYSGVISQAANTGFNDYFVSHDAANDPVTNFSLFVEPYSQIYGGVRSANEDYDRLETMAEATDGSKNNGLGNTSGWAVDFDWDAVTANIFDYINFGPVADSIVTGAGGGLVRYFRRQDPGTGNLADHGSDLLSRITVPADAMAYDPGTGMVAASAPLAGVIGKSDDSTLGNRSRCKFRLFVASGETLGGELQFDTTAAFTYTS